MAMMFEPELKRGQYTRAIKKALDLDDASPVRQLVEVGAQTTMDYGGREEVQTKMDEVVIREQSRLEARVEFLAMLGNVGTLLGLLGTIVGMTRSFASSSVADATMKATMLASGVSEALHATAYGLVMAIPALIMYSVLQNRVNKLSDDLHQSALRIYNMLGFHVDVVKTKKSS